MDAVIRHPAILDVVEDVIGPNIRVGDHFHAYGAPNAPVSLAVNPFRPDTHPSAQTGVAMITGADEAIAAHQRVAEANWRDSLKGPAGAARLRSLVNAAAVAA